MHASVAGWGWRSCAPLLESLCVCRLLWASVAGTASPCQLRAGSRPACHLWPLAGLPPVWACSLVPSARRWDSAAMHVPPAVPHCAPAAHLWCPAALAGSWPTVGLWEGSALMCALTPIPLCVLVICTGAWRCGRLLSCWGVPCQVPPGLWRPDRFMDGLAWGSYLFLARCLCGGLCLPLLARANYLSLLLEFACWWATLTHSLLTLASPRP